MEKVEIYVALIMAFLKWLITPFKRLFEKLEEGARIVQLCRLVANTSGQGRGTAIIGVLIGIMVSLLIGIILMIQLVNSQTPDGTWSLSANNTWTAIQANMWVAFGLLAITPIVIGAVIILGYVRRGM